jgi:hypothetical protein
MAKALPTRHGIPEAAAAGTLPTSATLEPADELFAALDGQVIRTSGDAEWELRIWGIFADRNASWLQFGLFGPQQIDAVMAVDPDSPAAAIRSIRASLQRRPHLLPPGDPVFDRA